MRIPSYFNFMGFTGSFQIKYDQNNVYPEVVVKRTDESNLKIEFTRDPNSNKIDSFTIFDTSGNRYVFSIYDINISTFVVDVASINVPNPIGEKPYRIMPYRSSWHLKEVYDANNKKILNFNYEIFTREHNLSSTFIPLIYSLKKLKEVEVVGISKINLSYTYSAVMDENYSPYFCDAFNLNEIIISDTKNNIVKKVIPEYDYFNFPILERDKIYPSSLNSTPKIRRYLKNIREINASNQEINKTSFSYKLNLPGNNLFLDSSGFVNEQETCFVKNPIFWHETSDFDQLYPKYEFALSNSKSSDYGILNGISYKTGGGYELLFETNTFSRTLEHAFSDNSFSKLNDDNKRYDLLYSLDYDTRNQNYLDFLVPNNPISKIYYFKFENESLNIPSQIVGESNPFFDEVQYQITPNFLPYPPGEFPKFFSDHMHTQQEIQSIITTGKNYQLFCYYLY